MPEGSVTPPMITVKDAIRGTEMLEVVDTPPMRREPSRTDRVEATVEVVTRAADIGSGEKTATWTATVAPAKKETAIAGAETAGLP